MFEVVGSGVNFSLELVLGLGVKLEENNGEERRGG